MVHALVIDDGDVGRLGRAAALEAAGHRATAVRWNELERLAGSTLHEGSHDVVLAALHADPTGWDRYPVVATLAAVTATLGTTAQIIALLCGAAEDNPLLAVRLQRAGADRIADLAQVRSVSDLDALASDPASASRPARPSDKALALAGVAQGTDPDGVVQWVEERMTGPQAEKYRNAFDPAYTQNACGLSRRQARALRVQVSDLARIRPNPLHSGGGPVRDRSLPRWNEVVAVANLCRGWDPDEARWMRDRRPAAEGGDAGRWVA